MFPDEFDNGHAEKHESLRNILCDLYRFICDRESVSLHLTSEARKLFQQERRNLYERKENSLVDSERSQLNKCHGRIGRLAGLFHLLWQFNPGGTQSQDEAVGIEAMKRAIAFNRYALSQSVLARQTAAGNNPAMQKLHAFHNRALKVKSPQKITDIRKALASTARLKTEETINIARALHEHGYGRVSIDDKGKTCYQALKPL
jgi:hypothetical protein